MDLTILLFGFCLAVMTGAVAATTLARMRPEWSDRRRLLVAAAILPTITLATTIAVLIAVVASDAPTEDGMRDLAMAALAKIGTASAAMALAGSFIGAALRQRGMRK